MSVTLNILITGASSGIGQALALDLAHQGHNLTLVARRKDKLMTLRDQLLAINKSIDIHIIDADVSHKDSVANFIKESANHFGGIDVIIANAGQGMWSRFRDLDDPDALLDLMNINYMGVVYTLFYGLPHLRSKKGSFVAISSVQGVIPVAFHTGYVASKYAVNGFIDTIRLEEPDVHFLLVQPSWISGTELRSHALTSDNKNAIKVKNKHGKHAHTTKECAQSIIKALESKQSSLFIPDHYKWAPLLRNLCPKTFDNIVMHKIKEQIEA